jgi:hypothetical protein
VFRQSVIGNENGGDGARPEPPQFLKNKTKKEKREKKTK